MMATVLVDVKTKFLATDALMSMLSDAFSPEMHRGAFPIPLVVILVILNSDKLAPWVRCTR
jgi:hypothetical protein